MPTSQLPPGWIECDECERPVRKADTYRRAIFGLAAENFICDRCHEDLQRRESRKIVDHSKPVNWKGI